MKKTLKKTIASLESHNERYEELPKKLKSFINRQKQLNRLKEIKSMNKNQINFVRRVLMGSPIIEDVQIQPETILGGISENTKKLVGRIARNNWFSHLRKHNTPARMDPYQVDVYREEGWMGWTKFMGYTRMLYEIEEMNKKYGKELQFIVLTKKPYIATDLYDAFRSHFLKPYNPPVFIIKDNGGTYGQILGDIDEKWTHERITEIIEVCNQSKIN